MTRMFTVFVSEDNANNSEASGNPRSLFSDEIRSTVSTLMLCV